MTIFVERLNALLKETNTTKYKLAQVIGVNKQAVAFWANGVNEPKISYLVGLCKYFDVSADYLLGLTDY